MEDTRQTDATTYARQLGDVVANKTGESTATIEQVKPGEVGPNQEAPRSDAGQAQQPATPPAQVNEASGKSTAQPNDQTNPDQSSSSKKKKKNKLGIF